MWEHIAICTSWGQCLASASRVQTRETRGKLKAMCKFAGCLFEMNLGKQEVIEAQLNKGGDEKEKSEHVFITRNIFGSVIVLCVLIGEKSRAESVVYMKNDAFVLGKKILYELKKNHRESVAETLALLKAKAAENSNSYSFVDAVSSDENLDELPSCFRDFQDTCLHRSLREQSFTSTVLAPIYDDVIVFDTISERAVLCWHHEKASIVRNDQFASLFQSCCKTGSAEPMQTFFTDRWERMISDLTTSGFLGEADFKYKLGESVPKFSISAGSGDELTEFLFRGGRIDQDGKLVILLLGTRDIISQTKDMLKANRCILQQELLHLYHS